MAGMPDFDPSAEEGAGPAAPAEGAEAAAPRPRRVGRRAKPRAGRRRAKAAPASNPTPPKDAAAPAGDAAEDHATELRPEVLAAESDLGDDPGGDDSAAVVLDVGTSPSLPVPKSHSSRSVPAVRAKRSRDQVLDQFLREMGKYPVLSTEEERALTTAYHQDQDPAVARKLVVHNLRLVVKMAYRYRRAWASVLDLIQEGNVGLVEAVQRFDPNKGAKFSTYATFWIRAYILRYLLEHSRTVRISRTRVGRKLFFQLNKERAKLRAQGIDPEPKLLADRLGVNQAELEDVVQHMDQSEVRLDAPLKTDDGGSGGTILDGMQAAGATPEAEAFHRAFSASVSEALASFGATLTDPREQAAWSRHLMTDDPCSLSELGKEFGVTKQRMGQIVSAMRKRLKTHLIDRLGPDVELGFQLNDGL